MSNEVNIVETYYGTIDPGVALDCYDWSGDYEKTRVKGRFFTVEPDPWVPLGDDISIELYSSSVDLEVTRTWATVWVGADGSTVFQRNATIQNIGGETAAYHLLRAETDN